MRAAATAGACHGSTNDRFLLLKTLKAKALPPLELVQQLLGYDPDTGHMHWLVSRNNNRCKPGSRAGGLKKHGYLSVAIDYKYYMVHRLAWLLHHGEDPGAAQIDHIDHDRLNNRISNLRLATPSQNLQNKRQYRNNSSGRTGVYWIKDQQKWQARIRVDDKLLYLGSFASQADAEAARASAEILHFPFLCHEGRTQ